MEISPPWVDRLNGFREAETSLGRLSQCLDGFYYLNTDRVILRVFYEILIYNLNKYKSPSKTLILY